jgi:hypothetical protein
MQNSNLNFIPPTIRGNSFRSNINISTQSVVPHTIEHVKQIKDFINPSQLNMAFHDFNSPNPTSFKQNNTIEWHLDPQTKTYNAKQYGDRSVDKLHHVLSSLV